MKIENEENVNSYDPKRYEAKWLEFWQQNGYFRADENSKKPPYVVLLPPPNVTSQLHLGHGLNASLQDLYIRWKRMKGFESCWLPGVDHAGIATQMMVERALEQEGTTRRKLGREAFFKRCEDWKDKYGGIIFEQLKQMGMSADWSRQAYTMDETLSLAVRKIFFELYNEGLIYRGERLVNWDCALQTAVSDDEVESQEINGKIWQFRYKIVGSNEFIAFATTRPETMLGDTALAVHPDDLRYKALIGKFAALPFDGRQIPIVADEYVKSDFGTGCVKITPAHDPNDFELGKRHKLPMINILNEDGTLNDLVPEKFRGLDRFVARKNIIAAMKQLELFDEEKNYKTALPYSERSKTVIEPRLSKQWYVKMQPLVGGAIEAAKDGRINFYPDLWKKTYLHWLENIQDWCISRQLWWGHRIPIWYCTACEHINCSMQDPSKCESCGSKELVQDEDVLDTWFSSWLWPLSPFGWPEDTQALRKFYPSDLLVTANEIIFLWVARMVMVGLKIKGTVPFKDVFFNPVICDQQGRKFSKTLGNGIDPLEVINENGADAARFTLLNLASVGGRVKIAKEDFALGSRFINKIWNASKFLHHSIDYARPLLPLEKIKLEKPEHWLLSRLAFTIEEFERCLEHYRTVEAVNALYHFIWGDFCDWGLESAKEAFAGEDRQRKDHVASLLTYVFEAILRLASPVIPFVCEELWHKLPKHPNWPRPDSLVVASFPIKDAFKFEVRQAEQWSRVQDLISEVRSIKSQAQLPRRTETVLTVKTDSKFGAVFQESSAWICKLAGVSGLEISENKVPGNSLVGIGAGFECYHPLDKDFDITKELKRLEGEKIRIEKILNGINQKLENTSFVANAPEEVIIQTKSQQINMQTQLNGINANLISLK